ncbi:DMT family transporter [Candidatus Hydrogenedentota bacterium]
MTSQRNKGIGLTLGSVLVFCVMSSLIRQAADINSYKTTFFRFVVGLGLLSTAAMFGKIELRFVHKPFLFLRGLIGGAAIFTHYLSIAKLGVGKGTVICYSYPIFATIFGAIFLKEKIGFRKAAAVLATFVGIYLLTVDNDADAFHVGSVGKYEAIAILGAILSGVVIVLIKKLHETDSTYAIFYAQCAIGLWLVIVPASTVPGSIGFSGGMLLLGIGITATVGQLLMTEGFRHITVTTGSILAMLLPVLNVLVGVTVFRESVSATMIIGSVIVVGSCSVAVVKYEE